MRAHRKSRSLQRGPLLPTAHCSLPQRRLFTSSCSTATPPATANPPAAARSPQSLPPSNHPSTRPPLHPRLAALAGYCAPRANPARPQHGGGFHSLHAAASSSGCTNALPLPRRRRRRNPTSRRTQRLPSCTSPSTPVTTAPDPHRHPQPPADLHPCPLLAPPGPRPAAAVSANSTNCSRVPLQINPRAPASRGSTPPSPAASSIISVCSLPHASLGPPSPPPTPAAAASAAASAAAASSGWSLSLGLPRALITVIRPRTTRM